MIQAAKRECADKGCGKQTGSWRRPWCQKHWNAIPRDELEQRLKMFYAEDDAYREDVKRMKAAKSRA